MAKLRVKQANGWEASLTDDGKIRSPLEAGEDASPRPSATQPDDAPKPMRLGPNTPWLTRSFSAGVALPVGEGDVGAIETMIERWSEVQVCDDAKLDSLDVKAEIGDDSVSFRFQGPSQRAE